MPTQNNTNSPAERNTHDDWQRLILQAVILPRLKDMYNQLKAELTRGMEPGDRRAIKNKQGVVYGSVSATNPSKKAVCTDSAVLLAMAEERGEEIIDALPAPGSEKAQQAIDFLFEFAPYLLDSGVAPEVEKKISEDVLERWQIEGEVPAGWEIKDASRSTIRITAGRSAAAKTIINRMLDSVIDVLELEERSK